MFKRPQKGAADLRTLTEEALTTSHTLPLPSPFPLSTQISLKTISEFEVYSPFNFNPSESALCGEFLRSSSVSRLSDVDLDPPSTL